MLREEKQIFHWSIVSYRNEFHASCSKEGIISSSSSQADSGECSCRGKPVTGLSVKPVKGDAVLFWSMGLDGLSDPNSGHGGCEELSGKKWSATKWMSQKYFLTNIFAELVFHLLSSFCLRYKGVSALNQGSINFTSIS
ncbi:hypothetical protein Ancab_032437 [Ancistrocladus abbreviatus]